MVTRHEKFINLATELALTEVHHRKKFYHAAVIVKNGKVLASDVNSLAEAKLFSHGESTHLHAETAAISNLLTMHPSIRSKFNQSRRRFHASFLSYFKQRKGLPIKVVSAPRHLRRSCRHRRRYLRNQNVQTL